MAADYRVVVNVDGVAFWLMLDDNGAPWQYGPSYCLGTWARAPAELAGGRAPCPVCGRVSAVSRVTVRVVAHYRAKSPTMNGPYLETGKIW